jgi:diguanylate cyclase (GGDEF)-like protein/PAS domain S-box-containing protein
MNERAEAPLEETAPAEKAAGGYAGLPRDAQLEYKAILANASIGIAFTRDRRFFLCNPKFAEMFGWKAEELIGQPGMVVYPSRESYEALGAIAVPVLGSGRQLDIEWEMRRKDGSTFLCRMIAKAINPVQTHQGTVWIVEDITERKRQAGELARLVREQEAILNSASIGICFVRDRKVVHCNRRFEEQHGYAPGELIGRPTAELYASEDDYRAVGEAYQVLASGRTFSTVALTRRKDGSTYWSRVTGCAIDPASPERGSVWLDEDITEQKRAAEELQRVLAEQQALTNNVAVGIAFVRERRVVRCNRRFEELFGFGPGEAEGLSVRDTYFTDDQYEKGGEVYAELDGGSASSREYWLRRRDGSGFWCRVSGRAVLPGDPARGYVWVFEDVTDRRRADAEVQRMVREQDQILDNATVGIAFVRNKVIQRVNRRLEEMTGYAAAELVGGSSAVLFADRAEWERAVDLAYGTTIPGGIHDTEWRFRRKDGSTYLCRTRGRRIDAGEADQQWIWSLEDVTAERMAEERVRRALAEQELIVENAQVGIVFVKDHVIQRCNRRAAEMHGYEPEELVNVPVAALHLEDGRAREEGAQIYERTPPGGTYSGETQLKRRDGSSFIGRIVGRRVDAGDAAQQWIWILEDVTAERATREALERMVAERTQELVSANRRLEAEIHDRKQAEERAQHLADHDPLTGLPNRRLLEDRLTQAIARGDRTQKPTAVMFVDLDHFKNINDTLGHAVGDVVLREVAERLVRQLRVGDTVCRIGGDEFIVVLPEITRSSDAAGVAQKILETVAQPFRADDRELQVSASIGISVFPDDGRDAETLIRNSDAAMYHAKETGRAGYQFFTEQMNVAASRRIAIESDLRRAVQENALRVHYQPIVDARSGMPIAYEALVRWQHPARGLVPPSEFLQIAEDTGLILRIGEWVLREACRWINYVGAERARPVSVNLSARQFSDPRLVERVAQVLADSGVPAGLLQLEVSEATAMQHADLAQSTLKKLRELGVSLALDNFGSAFSNTARLRRFALDRIKIDRSLVAETRTDKDSEAVIAAMVGLAHALGLKVVAEGVETDAQRELLRTCGCDYMQGFLFGRPAEPEPAVAPPDTPSAPGE